MTPCTPAVLLSLLCMIPGAVPAGQVASPANASTASRTEAPLGLWSWSAEQPAASHRITIERDAMEWTATLDGADAKVTHNQGTVRLEGPDGSHFIGELAADRSEVRGYWYQLPTNLDYQLVATPAVLRAGARGEWRAELQIQPRPFRIFLDVFEDGEQGVAAVVRNPEGNNIMRSSRFRVEKADLGWELISGRGDRERRYGLKRGEGSGWMLEHNRFDEPIQLERATETAGYYPRQGRDLPPVPKCPPLLDDDWPVADPEEVGFDADALRALTIQLAGSDPRSARPQMLHSVLVAHAGVLVYEEYFFGHTRETRHDVRSLGKVFGSVLIGALQQQGHLIDADHCPIPDVLKGAGHVLDDPRKADITLRHLLTFTSGLDCDANSDSAGAEWRMWEQQLEPDYWVFTSRLNMLHDPGERYAYCSGSANLVGASLRAFGGKPVHVLFDELIAQPLNFGPYHFALSPNGEGYLGGGAYMLPRDILKIGAMYLAGGEWKGQAVVDADWIEESQIPVIEVSPETTGMTASDFADNYFPGAQAYIWRVDTVSTATETYDSYEASGNGGQLLIVVPELDLAVCFTGGNYRMGGIWGRWRNEIIGGHIIPAMKFLR